MNYKKLKVWIYFVTLSALLLSIAGFLFTLSLPIGKHDFQGASGVGGLLPSFAGTLIAAFALYAYVKLEDATYVRAKALLVQRYELIAYLRSVTFQFQATVSAWEEFRSLAISKLANQLEEDGEIVFKSGGKTYGIKKNTLEKDKEAKYIEQAASVDANKFLKDSLSSVLEHLTPEISKSLIALTPIVLQVAASNKSISSTDWLKSQQGVLYALRAMHNTHEHFDNAMANLYASTEVVIKILSSKEFGRVDSIYELVESMTDSANMTLPRDLEKLCSEAREQIFQTIGTPKALGGEGIRHVTPKEPI